MREYALTPHSVSRNLFALVALLPEGVDAKTEYPALVKWHEGLVALPYVAAGIAEKAAASA
jgi:hypothetical protein